MDYALQSDFLQAIFRIKSILAAELGKDSDSGISMPEYILMKSINNNVPLTEVREYLSISKPAISQILGGLEKKGYLIRETDKSDRRNLRLSLTPAGQVTFHQKESRLNARFGKIAGSMEEEQLRQTIRLASQFSDCITRIRKMPPEKKP